MEAPAQLDRTLLSDQVYEVIRDRILAHELPPGVRVVESEVARTLGVSQAPVRDALRKLAHEGLVLQLPRRGSFVAEISADEARHSYAVRAALEEVAATEALARADGELIESLTDSLGAMRSAAKQDDVDAFIDADIHFHRAVWHAGGNALLYRIWPMVEITMRRFTKVSNLVFFGTLDEIALTHQPLLDGLKSQDAAVPALFRAHVNEVWQRYEKAGAGSAAGRRRRP